MHLLQRSIIFGCIVFLTLQQLANGLICYQCPACDTVNSDTTTTDVDANAGYSCYKFVGSAVGVSTVIRGAQINCQSGSGSIGVVSGSIYCCARDRCNAGIALSNSFGLIFVIIAISVVIRATIIG